MSLLHYKPFLHPNLNQCCKNDVFYFSEIIFFLSGQTIEIKQWGLLQLTQDPKDEVQSLHVWVLNEHRKHMVKPGSFLQSTRRWSSSLRHIRHILMSI